MLTEMLIETDGRISTRNKPLRLRCSVQNYDWGRIGSDASVARLYSASSGAEIDSSKPYAEFWMGTHESGPSFVVKKSVVMVNGNGCLTAHKSGLYQKDLCMNCNGDFEGETLKAWIRKNPGALGDKVLQRWGCDLPFLFKVLSVAKPLSIQAHPDKVLAKELHRLQPHLYKDDNHKPEMALALTEFEALCGFVEINELKDVVRKVPEIEDLVGHVYIDQLLNVHDGDNEEYIKSAVKSLFTEIMCASKDLVSTVLSKLKRRLAVQEKPTSKEQLALRLEEDYPNDVGVFAAFFMNHVKLNPGEALYLGANELHAYLSGDCVECMATSDNVVRAGLTPKTREVKTLCSMLTYNLGFPKTLKGIPMNKYTRRYRPPLEEFEVDRCILPEERSVSFPALPSPSIFVIMDGYGTMTTDNHAKEIIVAGDVFFAPANVEVNVKAAARLELYRAGVNSECKLLKPSQLTYI